MTSHPFEQLYWVYDAGVRFGPPDMVYPGSWAMKRIRPMAPPSITREEVASKFHEPLLVDAAFVILQKAHLAGTYDVAVRLDDFVEPTGFLHLLNYGAGPAIFRAPDMLRVSRENSCEFVPTASFWDRVVGQAQESEKA